ncbi:MAG TPA: ChaN family lipoprotein [Pyrinomonadaceae bacterium]|nr:ChaN family lipoprotein [Pyrinomonadaceae bacterium]
MKSGTLKYAARSLPRILLFIALLAQLAPAARAQSEAATRYRAFDSKGRAVQLEEIIEALDGADVLFVGERHDDATGHMIEAELLRRTDERYSRGAGRRRAVALSLEMFERDVQTVLDEYLGGLITERHFLLSSRPWNNYATDYRPLVEYAREHRLPVIAANAPARYVSRVSAEGPASLSSLSKEARAAWLPPLPFPEASAAYASKFNSFMSGGRAAATTHAGAQSSQQSPANPHAQAANPHGSLHLLEAQTLRDASMAYAVSEFLKRGGDPLVVQVNGTFHSEGRMGVPEQLAHYRRKARAVVVTIVPGEGRAGSDAASMSTLGDFIILTEPAR